MNGKITVPVTMTIRWISRHIQLPKVWQPAGQYNVSNRFGTLPLVNIPTSTIVLCFASDPVWVVSGEGRVYQTRYFIREFDGHQDRFWLGDELYSIQYWCEIPDVSPLVGENARYVFSQRAIAAERQEYIGDLGIDYDFEGHTP